MGALSVANFATRAVRLFGDSLLDKIGGVFEYQLAAAKHAVEVIAQRLRHPILLLDLGPVYVDVDGGDRLGFVWGIHPGFSLASAGYKQTIGPGASHLETLGENLALWAPVCHGF